MLLVSQGECSVRSPMQQDAQAGGGGGEHRQSGSKEPPEASANNKRDEDDRKGRERQQPLEGVGNDEHGGRRRNSIINFFNTHQLTFSLTYSILFVLSGAFFILVASGLALSRSFDILEATVGSFGERAIFAILGVLLVVTPFFLNSFVFQSLKHERDLRIRAEKSTREAQLLQDILAHDIRNYNQVSKMSAELIKEELAGNESVEQLVSSLLASIEGSTQLVERAKMLGRVISDKDLAFHPVNLLESIRLAVELVTGAHPERKVNAVVKLGQKPIAPLMSLDPRQHEEIEAMADNLIDEVFANLISNSVKYTEDGEEVFLAIEISKVNDRELKRACWKVAIADTGKGIPDDLKHSLFSRYLEGAKGSGLGMSIVHALVVGRYDGRIHVRDRIEHDHTKGTLVELWIPAA